MARMFDALAWEAGSAWVLRDQHLAEEGSSTSPKGNQRLKHSTRDISTYQPSSRDGENRGRKRRIRLERRHLVRHEYGGRKLITADPGTQACR